MKDKYADTFTFLEKCIDWGLSENHISGFMDILQLVIF
jgi:hypothetical protein